MPSLHQLKQTGDNDMKKISSAIGISATILTLATLYTTAAEAKKGNNNKIDYLTKKERKGPVPDSYIQGNYRFECMSWGDCQNFTAKK
jgi:hypothetical protein